MYVSKPNTFPSLIPSEILYLCNSSPKTLAVVLSFLECSSRIGVPVNPKNVAFGNVSFIVANMSPNVDLWHSSTIKTILLEFIFSKSLGNILESSFILLIFWIDVTINVSVLSSLNIFWISFDVLGVACISSSSSAKPLNSRSDWVPSSILSIKHITLSLSPEFAISCADLNEVIVFPEPVVCQIYPPSKWFPFQSFLIFETLSEILLAAQYW